MDIKPKKCFAIGKAKTYKGCGKLTKFRKFGLCMNCYAEWLYSTDLGKLELNKAQIRAKKSVELNRKKERSELKESLKSISKIISEIKPIFQKYIRLRDKDFPCISCGTFTANEFHGGHFKKAEIYSGVIFDERNCHKQCKKCNVFLGGNEGDYRVNLVKRFSENYLKELEEYANKTKNHKYTREELKEIKEKYKQKIKNYGT